MLEEFQRQLKLGIDLLSARFSIYLRKLEIRRAYAPVQAVVPIIVLSLLLILGATATVIAAVHIAHQFVPKNDNTATANQNQQKSATDEPQDSYIVPFPAIPGQEEMKFIIIADKYDRVKGSIVN